MSTIIKAGPPHSSGQSVGRVAFNFDDMAVQARGYLDQVRAQAAQILAEANQQAEAIRRQAEEQGRQAALRAVDRVMDEKVARQMKTVLPALHRAVEELQQARQAWLSHWQVSAVKVASAIARRVVRRELSQTPQITLDLVSEALQLAAGSADIAIHLNPRDAEALGAQVRQLTEALSPLSAARVVADAAVAEGGCLVETRFGVIDQQFEAQLKRIEEELI